MTEDEIFKRCGCRNDAGRRLERSCPRLTERGHGSWYFHCSATNLLGRPERARRGGYPSQAAARRARDESLATTGEDRTARSWTVERWLRYWLASRTRIRATTKLHYTRDAERFLIPHLGRLCLADLDARRLRAIFAEIAQTTNSKGQRQSASDAAPTHHPSRCAQPRRPRRRHHREPGPARRGPRLPQPHAKVWTDGRVEEWERTGERPLVAVWTADQLATFLNTVTHDALFALWWLTALRGLRRGEACGLRWSELEHSVLFVVRNRTTAGYQVVEGEPKTATGRRAVALDRHTVRTPFKRHRHRPKLPRRQKAVNKAHAKIRACGERAIASLKTWEILTKLRCCPRRATTIVQAILVLHQVETGATYTG